MAKRNQYEIEIWGSWSQPDPRWGELEMDRSDLIGVRATSPQMALKQLLTAQYGRKEAESVMKTLKEAEPFTDAERLGLHGPIYEVTTN